MGEFRTESEENRAYYPFVHVDSFIYKYKNTKFYVVSLRKLCKCIVVVENHDS